MAGLRRCKHYKRGCLGYAPFEDSTLCVECERRYNPATRPARANCCQMCGFLLPEGGQLCDICTDRHAITGTLSRRSPVRTDEIDARLKQTTTWVKAQHWSILDHGGAGLKSSLRIDGVTTLSGRNGRGDTLRGKS